MANEHKIKGRGTAINPPNRFETLAHSPVYDDLDNPPAGAVKTEFLRDTSKTIITANNSPDVGFGMSLNAYRGCEHGCAYCFARPYHEFLGYSAGLDFETKILVKENAAELLRTELMRKNWVPQTVAMSGVTDCYQPIERKLGITRSCLEVFLEFKNPVGLITKNQLVTRDIDILSELAKYQCAMVFLSITTLDTELARKMEPRTSTPQARLEAVRLLAQAGVPVGVMMGPIIPGLTDSEIPAVLKAAREAGAHYAGYTVVRLPGAVEQVFEDWLNTDLPGQKDKIMRRLADAHGGDPGDNRFGTRMRGEGKHAEQIAQVFRLHRARLGYSNRPHSLSTEHFARPVMGQMDLF